MPQEHTPHPPSFVDKKQHIHISGTKLPHWHQPHRTQFVTFRLGGTLPKGLLQQITALREQYTTSHDASINDRIEQLYDNASEHDWLQCPRLRDTVTQALLAQDHQTLDLYAFVVMPNHVHLLATALQDETLTEVIGRVKRFTSHAINKSLRQLHAPCPAGDASNALQQEHRCPSFETCRVKELASSPDTTTFPVSPLSCPLIDNYLAAASRQTTTSSSSQKPPFYWQREVFDYMVRDSVQFRQFVEYIKANPQHLPPHTFTLYSKI